MHFPDLNDEVRAVMLEEIHLDQEQNNLHKSRRLSQTGPEDWPGLLAHAAESGNPQVLANELRAGGYLLATEISHRNGKPYSKAVPRGAPETLAEGEFNRFYIRAFCIIALRRGQTEVEVYRAKAVAAPSAESEAKIGSRVGAKTLLDDLRENVGAKPASDSAGDVPDGRLAGPAPGCPRVDAWPLVTVRQAPGRGGDVPECGRRSARCIQGHDHSGSRPSSGCRHQLPLAPPGSSSRYTSPLPSGSAKKNIGGEPSRCTTSLLCSLAPAWRSRA